MTDVELPCRNIVNIIIIIYYYYYYYYLLPCTALLFFMCNFHDALNNVEITSNGLTKDFYVRGSNESSSQLPENSMGRMLPRLSLNFYRGN